MALAWRQTVPAFVLGAALGLAAGRWCSPWPHPGRWGGRQVQQQMLKDFSKTLRLTPEQRQRVGEMLEAKRQNMEALRAEVRPKFEVLRETTRTEIRQLLTPEQQHTFDVMDAKLEARRKRDRERWHGEGK